MPIDGGGYILDMDANNHSMVCVLQRMQGGEFRVTGYVSKAFCNADVRYCITRRELAVVMFGLCYYRHFLLGSPFILQTNHAALIHLM